MKKNNVSKSVVRSPKSVVHIYTGNGKGKTTAAIGLALRACGAKKRVAILQFMKKGDSSEIKAIKKYQLPIDVFAFGIGFFKILGDSQSKEAHQQAAVKGLNKAKSVIASQKYDLIILDEINVAIELGLIDIDEVVAMLSGFSVDRSPSSVVCSPSTVVIILTGRHAHPKLVKLADLVTLMKKQKHYFDQGQAAQKGIEY